MTFVLQMLETGKEKSPIHTLDPRAKLLWWISLIIVPILVTNPVFLVLVTLWIWVMAAVARVAGRMYRMLIVGYPMMVGFIMLTWPFFYAPTPDQHYLIRWAFLHVSLEGILYALAMGLRIVMALTACIFFVMTTDLMDLAGALGEFMQNRWNVSYMYPLMVISSFKFLPEMSGDYLTVTDAFRSRALDLDSGSFLERLRKSAPVALPLIDNMLRRAQSIAIALELKAFSTSNKKRTFYVQHHFAARDLAFALTGVLAIALCLLLIGLGWARVEAFL
ncbi:MAG: energy-coupling factor transporter transmembrane component T [Chloroflexi bacterium]|jgi:energy-coupling factor transport system permease protein|nr:energy-coupling factor transporter transmembrane component T [Chloroflexota bacterium]